MAVTTPQNANAILVKSQTCAKLIRYRTRRTNHAAKNVSRRQATPIGSILAELTDREIADQHEEVAHGPQIERRHAH